MNIQAFKWTDENICRLTEMSAKGMSSRAIGEKLGISRDAVLGKLFRMPELAEMKRKSTKKKAHKPQTQNRTVSPLTPDMISKASKLWAAGRPATEIAKEIGKTSKQLLNFAYSNRDHFPHRKQGRKAYKVKRAPSAEPAPDCIDPSIFLPPAGYDAERIEHGKQLHELSNRCCHWPLGNGGPFIFCAAPTQVTNGYCEHHRKRAFKPRLALD